jgi:ATP-dependent Clp protease adaptor protein ClpS
VLSTALKLTQYIPLLTGNLPAEFSIQIDFMSKRFIDEPSSERFKFTPRSGIDEDEDAGGIDHDTGIAETTEKPKLEKPPLYKVVLINDDYTPMDFVVEILVAFFDMNVEKATQIMLKVHTEGKGVCGVYSKDVAETKAAQVNDYSRDCEQPLLCSVEVDR